MCICVYVLCICMYVYVYACVCVYVYVYVCICTYMYKFFLLFRYFSIKYPHSYRRLRTDNRVLYAITVNWIVSFLIWVPLILGFAYTEGTKEEMIRTNACDVGSAKIIPATVIGCCVSYVLPVFIIIYFAIDSVYILMKMKGTISKQNPKVKQVLFANDNKVAATSRVDFDNTLSAPIATIQRDREWGNVRLSRSVSPNNQGAMYKRTTSYTCKKVVKGKANIKSRLPSITRNLSDYQWVATFNVLLGVSFVVNILPFGVLAVTRSICLHISGTSCISTEWWYFGYIMCYLNSMLNPICYAFGNKNFKRAFKLLLCERKSRTQSISSEMTFD